MHSREAAVGALELFTDHREVIHCKDRHGEGGRGRKKKGEGRGGLISVE